MAWDKFRMAQRFLQRANAIHPEDAEDDDSHDEALALQDVYYDCYMSSFSKEDLVKRLLEIVAGKIEMPEEEGVDEERYRAIYLREAGVILASIERDELT
jgi:hypothetical protein